MNISVPSSLLGCTILDLQVSRTCKGLVGSWSAILASSSAPADVGDDVTLSGVFSGMVTMVQDLNNGSWRLEGNDNGIKLMKSTPARTSLTAGSISSQISQLATHCGVATGSISTTSPTGISDCRTLVQGSTCAEAISLLARLGGSIARINAAGQLVVGTAGSYTPPSSNILRKDGRALDTDGYASGVFCTVHRRGEDPTPIGGGTSTGGWVGTTPGGTLTTVTEDGITRLEPLGLITGVNVTESDSVDGASWTQTITETYTYETETDVVQESAVEYRVWRWRLTGSTKTRTTSRTMGLETQSESTTETLTRTYTSEGLTSEVVESVTTRTDAPEGIVPPPYDVRIERTFSYKDTYRQLQEIRREYKLTEVGYNNVLKDVGGNPIKTFVIDANAGTDVVLGVVREQRYVLVRTKTTVFEGVDEDSGECTMRRESSFCDDGAQFYLESGIYASEDDEAALIQMLKLLPVLGDVRITPYPRRFSIDAKTWEELRIPGRRMVGGSSSPSGGGSNLPTTGDCPYFDSSTGDCYVYNVAGTGEGCLKSSNTTPPTGWTTCIRYEYMRDTAVTGYAAGLLEKPVVGTAGGGKIWAEVSVYFDEIFSDGVAQTAANLFASNVLNISQAGKGITESLTFPLNYSLEPNGELISVAHDFKGLKTTVTYATDATVPECMLMRQASSVASAIQQNNRYGQEVPGIVQLVNGEDISVLVRGQPIMCRSRVGNVGAGCAVLVYLPPGAEGWGVIRDIL